MARTAADATARVWAVDADRAVHSLHSYFIRPGDPRVPIVYEIEHAGLPALCKRHLPGLEALLRG